jgi:rubrerythrin
MTLTHHRLVAEWDIVRNDRAPDEVSAGSQYRAWWTCGDCGHSWRAHVVRRARGQRCPACTGKVATERTCLLAQRPDLTDEWDWCRNPRTPRDVTPGSSYRARWRCRSCGHAWTQSVNKRNLGAGCPAWAGRVVTELNSFAALHPELLAEWDPRNERAPTDLTCGVNYRASWSCRTCAHTWDSTVAQRSRGTGCPACAGLVTTAMNSLAVKRSDLVAEWDGARNLRAPDTITPGSDYRAHWACQHCGHCWQPTVAKRSAGSGCPACAGRHVTAENCLAKTHPQLAEQWDTNINHLTPTMVVAGSHQRAWWLCPDCGHGWEGTVQNRVIGGHGCPACARQVATATNNVTVTHPHLVPEWCPANDRSATDVLAGSHYRAAWRCGACGHRWSAEVNKRSSGQGCPACSARGWNVAKLRAWLRSQESLVAASLEDRRAQAVAVGLLRGWGVARTIVEDALLAEGFPSTELQAFADGKPSTVDELIRTHDPRRYAGRRALPHALRRHIIERDRSCRACDSPHELHVDHVIPLAAGGTDDAHNLQVLCATCNCVKGGRPLTIAQLRAARGLPVKPAATAA